MRTAIDTVTTTMTTHSARYRHSAANTLVPSSSEERAFEVGICGIRRSVELVASLVIGPTGSSEGFA